MGFVDRSSPSLLGKVAARRADGGAEQSEELRSALRAAPPPCFAWSPSPSKLGEDL